MIVENKKVKNATQCEYDGIKFRSELERSSYILLSKEGFHPEYEKSTFQLWKGKKFLVPCYDLHKDRKLKRKVWGNNSYKFVSIKYTPDFIFHVSDSSGADRMVVIEAKGQPNDVYPYKKKLFLQWLDDNNPDSLFFEVHNQKQLKQAIEVIKSIRQ